MTYAQDLANIQANESKNDEQLVAVIGDKGLTANALTHFDSDHTADVAEPTEGKQHVVNHDDIIEVTASRSAAVKTGKESFDAFERSKVIKVSDDEVQVETGE